MFDSKPILQTSKKKKNHTLTVNSYTALSVPYGVFRYTFVPTQICLAQMTNGQLHVHTVVHIAPLCHDVLFILDYHVTWKTKKEFFLKISQYRPILINFTHLQNKNGSK